MASLAVVPGVVGVPGVAGAFGVGGVPGVAPAEVLIIGGGIVETNAAKVAAGLGAEVTITDISLSRLQTERNACYEGILHISAGKTYRQKV